MAEFLKKAESVDNIKQINMAIPVINRVKIDCLISSGFEGIVRIGKGIGGHGPGSETYC